MDDTTLHPEELVIVELKPRRFGKEEPVVLHEGSGWLILNTIDIPEQYLSDTQRILVVSTVAGPWPTAGYGTDDNDWYIRGHFGDRDLLIVSSDTAEETLGLSRYLRRDPRKAEIASEDFGAVQDPEVKERLDYWSRITSLLRREGVRHGFRGKEAAA